MKKHLADDVDQVGFVGFTKVTQNHHRCDRNVYCYDAKNGKPTKTMEIMEKSGFLAHVSNIGKNTSSYL